jgi:hypothetical protein
MIAERQKLFDEGPEEPDLSRFAPRTDTPPAPSIEAVRTISAAAGFPNRDPVHELPRIAPIAERHYYRTGRDTQFNTKVRADTKAAFVALAREDGVPLGKVLEDALDALMRERQSRRAGEATPPA